MFRWRQVRNTLAGLANICRAVYLLQENLHKDAQRRLGDHTAGLTRRCGQIYDQSNTKSSGKHYAPKWKSYTMIMKLQTQSQEKYKTLLLLMRSLDISGQTSKNGKRDSASQKNNRKIGYFKYEQAAQLDTKNALLFLWCRNGEKSTKTICSKSVRMEQGATTILRKICSEMVSTLHESLKKIHQSKIFEK